MGVLDSAKELVQVVQKIDNLELYRQILNLQSEILTLVEENNRLREELKTAREDAEVQACLEFRDNGYWIDVNGSDEGPYCTHCWDRDRKLVRMHMDNAHKWYCVTHGKPTHVAHFI